MSLIHTTHFEESKTVCRLYVDCICNAKELSLLRKNGRRQSKKGVKQGKREKEGKYVPSLFFQWCHFKWMLLGT
jgi:hypothetical protein